MPNFHVHWLVAWQALDDLDGPAKVGRAAYHDASLTYAKHLRESFDVVLGQDLGADAARDVVDELFDEVIPGLVSDWRQALYRSDAIREAVSCFSAYMLGACGPDFWMLPSWCGALPYPYMGEVHFDLGHYNRTHEQFKVSIERIANDKDPQSNLERSYFLGMATHVAADLVLHQLVNVYAGAYNLLAKYNWDNEHSSVPLKNPWHAHNKVEHFWDSFVRYRYLGDLTDEAVLFDPREGEWIQPLGFPLAETLVLRVRRSKGGAAKKELVARLTKRNKARKCGKGPTSDVNEISNDARVLLETPLVLPAIACDRILGESVPDGVSSPTLEPFIYDVVVNKRTGAYPARIAFQEAIDEARHDQMSDDRWFKTGLNEVRKLRYLATERNTDTGIPIFSSSFLTYLACPDVDRLLQRDTRGFPFGRAFFEPAAVARVGRRAVGLARSFVKCLANAYESKDAKALNDVARFWNLDVGTGFEVQSAKTTLEQEVVTRLDFVHVLSSRIANLDERPDTPEGELGYARPTNAADLPYLASRPSVDGAMTQEAASAFPLRTSGPGTDDAHPFDSPGVIEEPDADRFLDRIRVRGDARERLEDLDLGRIQDGPRDPASVRAERRAKKFLEVFFAKEESAIGWTNPFGTATREMKKVFAAQKLRERITLEFRVPIPTIGDGNLEEPGMFLYCDDALGLGDAATMAPHEWLVKKAKLVRYRSAGRPPGPEKRGKLRVFTAPLLVNVRKSEERIVAAGSWNNVIPYGANKQFYGRNFAVATGRKFVLHPTGKKDFDPFQDFEYYGDITPTEHVFLTIYPLVKTPWGVVDAFSDEQVGRGDFDDIRRISAVQWKKVVLFYRLAKGKDAAAPRLVQLRRCMIDGAFCDVEPVPTERQGRAGAPAPAAPAPAGEQEPPIAAIQGNYIRLGQRIEFDRDKDAIPPASRGVLDAVAGELRNHPEVRLVEIRGHTCDLGAPAHNLDLSRRRAEAVKRYLVGKGIAEGRLTAVGKGDTMPAAAGTSPQARRKNRRVEFVILQQ